MSELADVLFRVDPRLVHATLMNAWVPAARAHWLLIADAQVLNDPRRRTIYEMSASDAVDVAFVAEPGVADRLATLREEGPGIVLFSSLAGVLRAMRGGLALPRLNVGHVPAGPGRKEVHPAVHLGSGDLEMLRQIAALDVEVFIQALPDDPPMAPPVTAPPTGPAAPAADEPDDTGPLPVTRVPSPPPAPPKSSTTHARDVLEVVNERGLHLRAAHILAALCNELPVEVKVGRGDELVNAKSLLGLTTLGAARGSRLDVVVDGEGADAALERIRALFADGFYEGKQG